jgi:hypothetical protein
LFFRFFDFRGSSEITDTSTMKLLGVHEDNWPQVKWLPFFNTLSCTHTYMFAHTGVQQPHNPGTQQSVYQSQASSAG